MNLKTLLRDSSDWLTRLETAALGIYETKRFRLYAPIITAISVAFPLGQYVWEAGDRAEDKRNRAWQLVVTASSGSMIDKIGNVGAKNAIETLVKDDVSVAGVRLHGAWLEGINLKKADLRHSNFSATNVSGANFAGASLSGATFDKALVSQADFSLIMANSVDFSNIQVYDYSNIEHLIKRNHLLIQGQTPRSTVSFSKAVLSDAVFMGSNIEGADFSGSHLVSVRFARANLSGATFQGSELQAVEFFKSVLSGVDFTGAQVRDVSFEGSCGTGAEKLPPGTAPLPMCE